MDNYFEQGPIRPPSEATSLLIRVTRNCPWNKCAFCQTYRGTKFEIRSVEDVKGDIQTMKDYADQIMKISWKLGEGGRVNRSVLKQISNQRFHNDYFQTIAVWLYFGGENVFLQDANSLIAKTPDLVAILDYLKEKFPQIKRITSYCRSHTAARKTVNEFEQLKNAGLSRIHVGMESGSNEVLALVNKGVTADIQIKAGQNIKQAGIELSEYFIPGLGGEKFTIQNALESAKVINAVSPDFIRLRTLHVVPGTALEDLVKKGEIQPLSDDDIIREIGLFIENLDVYGTQLVSDHILNLLEELEGKFPEDKPKILAVIKRYFEMNNEERMIFRLGRRSGAFRRLDDLGDKETYLRLKAVVESYAGEGRNLDDDMVKIMNNYI
ncbi:MAG: coproporphyrinogen III oxidase [Deltaproteobacteria bacterium RBG_16_44_11]|nr:MAG: coproporphyrinogen III oxidase [Deltaproteobacteria bacterium RBG_16_44_11]